NRKKVTNDVELRKFDLLRKIELIRMRHPDFTAFNREQFDAILLPHNHRLLHRPESSLKRNCEIGDRLLCPPPQIYAPSGKLWRWTEWSVPNFASKNFPDDVLHRFVTSGSAGPPSRPA